jgi:pimeloyl-ACP methyl ester carboxylesterase
MKRSVILIHGICSEGQWQDEIKDILGAHFDVHLFKYTEYRQWGFVKVLFGRFWWLYCGVVVALACLHGVLGGLAVVFGGISVLMAILDGVLLRKAVYRRFVQRVIKGVGYEPHIIAHSFGTYVVGKALRNYLVIRAGTVVLVGAVLRVRYDWDALRQMRPPKYTHVWNEVARLDWISCLAYLVRGLIPPLGHAGFRGFKSTSGNVHTVDDFRCDRKGCGATVHNMLNRHLGHNNLVDIARRQLLECWLPVLWGIDVVGYVRFLSACRDAVELTERGDVAGLAAREDELGREIWDWAGGSVRKLLKRHIQLTRQRLGLAQLKYRDMEDRVDSAMLHLWNDVARAVGAASGVGAVDGLVLGSLFPVTAAVRAAEAVARD